MVGDALSHQKLFRALNLDRYEEKIDRSQPVSQLTQIFRTNSTFEIFLQMAQYALNLLPLSEERDYNVVNIVR